jgi:hypothetical protein
MTATLGVDAAPLTLGLWRDHDEEVLDLPGVSLGEIPAEGDPAVLAQSLYDRGVRRVGLSRPVDLTGEMDAAMLTWVMILLRDLSGLGVVVDWRLRPGAHGEVWQRLNHLSPPAELIGQPDGEEALASWRETFYMCKCIYRHGPGFVEVRDRRSGSLARFVIDDPEYLAAVERLIGGANVADVPEEVLAAFVEEGLAGLAGESAWWLPYRVRRWPWPSMIV